MQRPLTDDCAKFRPEFYLRKGKAGWSGQLRSLPGDVWKRCGWKHSLRVRRQCPLKRWKERQNHWQQNHFKAYERYGLMETELIMALHPMVFHSPGV
jgi:hypothetical protein